MASPVLAVAAIGAFVAVLSPSASAVRATVSAKAGTAAVQVFMSPSANIRCRHYPTQAVVACLTLNNGITVTLPVFDRPTARHTGPDPDRFPVGHVVGYGRTLKLGRQFRCLSREDGMRCLSLRTGYCFITAREGYRFPCRSQVVPRPRPPTAAERRSLIASMQLRRQLLLASARASGNNNPHMTFGKFRVSRTDSRFAGVSISPSFANGAYLILRRSGDFWGEVDLFCCDNAGCDGASTRVYLDLYGRGLGYSCPEGARELFRPDATARVPGRTGSLHRPRQFSLDEVRFTALRWRGWGRGVASANGRFCQSANGSALRCVPVTLHVVGVYRVGRRARYSYMAWTFGRQRLARWAKPRYAVVLGRRDAQIVS